MSSAALRLFGADGVSVDPSSSLEAKRRWTLREAYENTLRRDQERSGIAARTIEDYETTLDRWDEWLSLTDASLAISEITEEELNLFLDWIEAGRSGRTVNKHRGNVEAILRRCGPKGPHNRHGRKILDEFVFVEPRDESRDAECIVRPMPRDDFERIYGACRVATRPAFGRTPPPLTWRTLLLLLWTFGPRRTDAFRMADSAVSFKTECPAMLRRRIENPHGWLSYTPKKTRRFKPQRLVLPLPKGLAAHLRQVEGRDNRLFPFNGSFRAWREEFLKIQAAAGIDQPYTFKELRKTANVEWGALDADLGEHVLGHAPRDVNTRHYKDPVGKLVAFIDSYPLADRLPD